MTISINNKNFQVYNPTKYKPNIDNLSRYAGRTIDDCYNKTSEVKKSIYEEWLKWAKEANIDYFGVSSYNHNMFTLQGLYVDENGQKYILSITPKIKLLQL